MIPKRKKLEFDFTWLRAWFDLTAQERVLVAGILAIALVGVAARYLYLRSEKAEVYTPAGLEQAGYGRTP